MKKHLLVVTLALGLIFSLSFNLLPKEDKSEAKLAKMEAKLEQILGTNSNWKANALKDLRYAMPCNDVRKFFPGLKCNNFKKYDFPKVSGKLFGSVKEYQFTFKYGKLESVTIVFGARLFDAKVFGQALLNVSQRKWGNLPPEKLAAKNKFWYNSDRDSVMMSYYNSNWQLKISMPKRDTGDVHASEMSENEMRESLAKLLGTSKSFVIPANEKFKRGMYCGQVLQVYKTMTGCDPVKNYSWGTVTIKDHPLVHALKFTFDKGQLLNATLMFHRQVNKEMFKTVSKELFEKKWGTARPGAKDDNFLSVYKSNVGSAQRSWMRDHWEIKHDFPK